MSTEMDLEGRPAGCFLPERDGTGFLAQPVPGRLDDRSQFGQQPQRPECAKISGNGRCRLTVFDIGQYKPGNPDSMGKLFLGKPAFQTGGTDTVAQAVKGVCYRGRRGFRYFTDTGHVALKHLEDR